ncbi:MAG: serine/threonine-protein kinase [Myxococcota bacterium]
MDGPADATGETSDEAPTRRIAAGPADAWPERVDSGDGPPVQLGRYRLGEPLGAGGMGIVYRAHDPKLARPVALKLLRTDRRGADERSRGVARLIREARAMAQLSHPNVITVFDVGTFDDASAATLGRHMHEAFVAMELIEGQTLRQWLRAERRPWRVALQACIRAGQGLAAAHRAALVHRDFKPGNVLMGDDGRVLVMDFGLAASHGDASAPTTRGTTSLGADAASFDERLTQAGAVVGTPAYMAPELFAGHSSDTASDQFAFCVTAFEAIFGTRPFAGKSFGEVRSAIVSGQIRSVGAVRGLPRHIRAAIVRGLDPQPERRWPTMDDLLARLQQRGRRAAPVIATAGIAAAGLLAWPTAPTSVCATKAQGDATQRATQRQALDDALRASDAAYADTTAKTVAATLGEWDHAWVDARDRACAADRGAPRQAQRLACLDAAAAEVDASVAAIIENADTVIERVQAATASLPDPSACLDATADAPPEASAIDRQLARARALRRAGQYDAALGAAQQGLESARSLDHAPTLARALALVGTLLHDTGDASAAAEHCQDAVWIAGAANEDSIAAEAATSLVRVVGLSLARFDEGHVWARHAEAALSRTPDHDAAYARLLNNVGLLLDEEDRTEEARSSFVRALAIVERVDGPTSLAAATILNNLGSLELTAADYDASIAWSRRALDIKVDLLGPDHPGVASTLNNIGIAQTRLGHFAEASEPLRRALAIRERSLAADHPLTATSLNNLGNAIDDLGQWDEALALHERALAMRERTLGPDHLKVSSSATNLANVYQYFGRNDDALRMLKRSLQIDERVYGPDAAEVGLTLFNLAVLEYNTGRYAECEASATRAMELVERNRGRDHHHVGRIAALLAAALKKQDRPEQAIALYGRAIAIYDGVLPTGHDSRVDARCERGWLRFDLERFAKSREDFEAAQAELEHTEAPDPILAGRVHYGLAKALRATGGAKERVAALVDAAAKDFGDQPEVVERIRAWMQQG